MLTIVVSAIMLLVGCDPSGTTGDPVDTPTVTFPSISGTITAGEDIDIDSVKVGLFLKGNENGDNPEKNLKLNSDTTNWRVYSQLEDGETILLTPDVNGSINATDNTFFINIPSEPPVRGEVDGTAWSEGYYAVAWYDGNEDGKLSLINNNTGGGEYNRLASKSITLKEEANTPTYVDFIEQDELDSKKYQFKYYKAADTSVYEHITLTEDNCSGFNFNIQAKTE